MTISTSAPLNPSQSQFHASSTGLPRHGNPFLRAYLSRPPDPQLVSEIIQVVGDMFHDPSKVGVPAKYVTTSRQLCGMGPMILFPYDDSRFFKRFMATLVIRSNAQNWLLAYVLLMLEHLKNNISAFTTRLLRCQHSLVLTAFVAASTRITGTPPDYKTWSQCADGPFSPSRIISMEKEFLGLLGPGFHITEVELSLRLASLMYTQEKAHRDATKDRQGNIGHSPEDTSAAVSSLRRYALSCVPGFAAFSSISQFNWSDWAKTLAGIQRSSSTVHVIANGEQEGGKVPSETFVATILPLTQKLPKSALLFDPSVGGPRAHRHQADHWRL